MMFELMVLKVVPQFERVQLVNISTITHVWVDGYGGYIYPRCAMCGIFTYIYPQKKPSHVGKYSSTMVSLSG